MNLNVGKELAALQRMSVADLRRRYAEVFGETTNSGHREWLVKRIIYRMQLLAEGDLSERARRRAAGFAVGGAHPGLAIANRIASGELERYLTQLFQECFLRTRASAVFSSELPSLSSREPRCGCVGVHTYQDVNLRFDALTRGGIPEGAMFMGRLGDTVGDVR